MDNVFDGTHDTNRRKSSRRGSESRVWADPGGVLPVIDCKILDISANGARVRALHGGELPDQFILKQETTNIIGKADVIWRNGNTVGVKIDRS